MRRREKRRGDRRAKKDAEEVEEAPFMVATALGVPRGGEGVIGEGRGKASKAMDTDSIIWACVKAFPPKTPAFEQEGGSGETRSEVAEATARLMRAEGMPEAGDGMEGSPGIWGPPEEGAQGEESFRGRMYTEVLSRGMIPSKKKAPFIPDPAMATRDPMN